MELAEKNAHKALLKILGRQKHDAYQRTLSETTNQGVIIQDSLGFVLFVSPIAERILGVKRDHLVGSNHQNLNWKAIRGDGSDFPVSDFPGIIALRTGEAVTNVVLGFSPEGENVTRWLLVNSIPVFSPGESTPCLVYSTIEDITERYQAEGAQRERDSYLRLVLNQMPTVIWTTDLDLRVTSAAGKGLAALGLTAEQVKHRKVTEIFGEESNLPFLLGYYNDALAGIASRFEITVQGLSFEVYLEPFYDCLGNLIGCIGGAWDFTKRKQAEIEAQRKENWLHILSDASRIFARGSIDHQPMTQQLQAVAELAARKLGDVCIIALCDEKKEYMQSVAFYHQDPQIFDYLKKNIPFTPYRLGEGYAGKVAKTGEPLLITNFGQDDIAGVKAEHQPYVEKYTIGSLAIVPMCANGEVVGTLGLSRSRENLPYTQEDLNFLQDLADRAGLAIYTARLLAENSRLLEKERQRSEDLSRSNDLIAALGLVSAYLQVSLEPMKVMTAVGRELGRIGIACSMAIFDSSKRALVIQYSSMEQPDILSALKSDSPWQVGAKVPVEKIPHWDSYLKKPGSKFIANPMADGMSIFPFGRGIGGQNFENLRAILCPLFTQNQMLGVMILLGEHLRESDCDTFSVFANQVAIALDNARMFEKLSQQREQVVLLNQRLAESDELKRKQISQELHDRVGQTLTALSINLNILKEMAGAKLSPKVPVLINDSLDLLNEAIERTRDIMVELRPSVLDDYGLSPALAWYGHRFSIRTGIKCQISGGEQIPGMPASVETALFRIAQEALTNVMKHSKAKMVVIRLEESDQHIRMIIQDDGIGFDPTTTGVDHSTPTWGVITMRERAEAVGGSFRIDSSSGNGTIITIEVPQ